MLNSAQQNLYVALILQLSKSLFSALWDSEYQLLPEKYLKEVAPDLWATRRDIDDLLPDKDVIFNDYGSPSNFRSRLNILRKLSLCRDMTNNTYAFVVDYDEIEGSIRSSNAWNIVTLSEVAGAYFESDERSLDLEPVTPAMENTERFCVSFVPQGSPARVMAVFVGPANRPKMSWRALAGIGVALKTVRATGSDERAP